MIEADFGWGVGKTPVPDGYRFAPNLAESPFPGSSGGISVNGYGKRAAPSAGWQHNILVSQGEAQTFRSQDEYDAFYRRVR